MTQVDYEYSARFYTAEEEDALRMAEEQEQEQEPFDFQLGDIEAELLDILNAPQSPCRGRTAREHLIADLTAEREKERPAEYGGAR